MLLEQNRQLSVTWMSGLFIKKGGGVQPPAFYTTAYFTEAMLYIYPKELVLNREPSHGFILLLRDSVRPFMIGNIYL